MADSIVPNSYEPSLITLQDLVRSPQLACCVPDANAVPRASSTQADGSNAATEHNRRVRRSLVDDKSNQCTCSKSPCQRYLILDLLHQVTDLHGKLYIIKPQEVAPPSQNLTQISPPVHEGVHESVTSSNSQAWTLNSLAGLLLCASKAIQLVGAPWD